MVSLFVRVEWAESRQRSREDIMRRPKALCTLTADISMLGLPLSHLSQNRDSSILRCSEIPEIQSSEHQSLPQFSVYPKTQSAAADDEGRERKKISLSLALFFKQSLQFLIAISERTLFLRRLLRVSSWAGQPRGRPQKELDFERVWPAEHHRQELREYRCQVNNTFKINTKIAESSRRVSTASSEEVRSKRVDCKILLPATFYSESTPS